MCINLGGADTGMTEHLLHGEQVGAAFQEVCGKAVPEGVWADALLDAVALGQLLHQEEHRLACQASASAVEEGRVGELGFHGDVFPCAIKVLIQDFQAGVADGNKPFLAAFAEDAKEPVILINIADLQADQLRNT